MVGNKPCETNKCRTCQCDCKTIIGCHSCTECNKCSKNDQNIKKI